MSDSSRLPARPSLEQLQKQAKDLLRQYRAGDAAVIERFRAFVSRPAPTLADAQFVLAHEYGFETWAKLKHRLEAASPSSLEQYRQLAKDLATAYAAADKQVVRELNWGLGTSFVWDHESEKMQQRLPNWFASPTRTPELALADAQQLLARSCGFENWDAFADSFARAPFYKLDAKENTISLRGLLSEKDWDAVCEVMKERRITRLRAGGITDAGMDRITRLDHLTSLELGNSNRLTDEGVLRLSRMPQLQELDLAGAKGVFTDRGLEVLRALPQLRTFRMGWQPNVSDAGIAHLASCDRLETVDLMGTSTGDGAIRALAGKPGLRRFKTGRNVTDTGLALLHNLPVFKTWQGGAVEYGLMSAEAMPNHLLVDGPFTNAGIASLVGLDGIFGLSFFWHCCAFTGDGLEPLKHLPRLGMLGCEGERCDDRAMQHIAAIPGLRMLMAQGSVASDAGFAALSRSRSIEHIWGRECPNLTGRGFTALSEMPALRGLAVSCKSVDDAALSTLPHFPALRDFTAVGVSDDGFRHVGRCHQLERLWCMYCRDTGDTATAHIAKLPNLKLYYAGATQITDRSLEILSRMDSLETLEFWDCARVTNTGVALLARLPRLRELNLHNLPSVTQPATGLFPARVRIT